MVRKLLLAALGAMALSQPAFATSTISGSAAINEWNLITLGDLTANSAHVHGRAFVGGSVTGSGTAEFNMDATTSSRGQPGLSVVGNVSAGTRTVWGGATIGGSSTNAIGMNGALQTVKVGGTMPLQNVNGNTVQTGVASAILPGLTSERSALVSSMIALSDSLATLSPTTSTASVTIASNTATFKATGSGLNVIALNGSSLGSFNQISFSNTGTTVVNVSGSNILLDDNFLGAAQSLGSNVVWNFYQATNLTLNNAFYGSILAPRASAVINQDIYGRTIVDSLALTGEIHDVGFTANLPTQTGAVPEPASWAMMISGFGLIGAGLRRRRSVRLNAA